MLYTNKSTAVLSATSFGHCWFYDNGNKRLVGFNPAGKKVRHILQPKELEKRFTIATIFEDNNHLLWVGTWEYDIFTIDYLNKNKVNRIQHDKNNLSSIAADFFGIPGRRAMAHYGWAL